MFHKLREMFRNKRGHNSPPIDEELVESKRTLLELEARAMRIAEANQLYPYIELLRRSRDKDDA